MNSTNNSNGNGDASRQIRDRLLDAAEECFCEHGYEATNIRDLTAMAQSNIAAVNYHFGGKENLYFEVFHRRMKKIRDVRIMAIEKTMSQTDHEVTLEELLNAFANAFIEPLLDESGGRRFMMLMINEMINPRLSKEAVINDLIVPTVEVLGQGLEKVCPQLEKKKIPLVVFSVIGQLAHALHFSQMFKPISDDRIPDFSFSDMVDHIVEFSAAGIRASFKGMNK